MTDTCEAQLKHKYIDLRNGLGRSPVQREFIDKYGPSVWYGVQKVYGTWNNAVTHFGFEPNVSGQPANRARRSRLNGILLDSVAVLASLKAWYAAHGELPTALECKRKRGPLLHSDCVYLRAFKTDSWPEAMRRAAALLNIFGGRYGLPESARGAA